VGPQLNETPAIKRGFSFKRNYLEVKMKRKLPDPAYYGEKSRDFWRVINSLPTPHRGTVYALGVALQNAESSLRFLIENEMSNAQKKLKVK
jgi:hypothetical protein